MKSYETDTMQSQGSPLHQGYLRQDVGCLRLPSDPNNFPKQAQFKKMMTAKFEKSFKKVGRNPSEGPGSFPTFLSKILLRKSIKKFEELTKTRGSPSKDFSGQKVSTRGLRQEIQTLL
jgi:hypothetical protein